LSAISSRNNALDALLHPIAILFFISILAYSYLYRKSITWKDRTL
jgi:preprotein translocase subunit SecG